MKNWMYAAVLLAAPALAQLPLPTKDEPAKKEAAKKDAAKSQAAAQGTTLARVNGVAVPRARQDLLMQQQGARGMPDNEQTRALVRDELINREVLYQEAQKAGVGKKPEVQAQVDMARQDVVVSAYVRDWVRTHPVTDADVQKEYDRAKSQTGDKEYRARHILVETEEQAKGLIDELKKGGKFEDLATKNSKDPGSAQRGGDLDWNVPGTYDKQFADALVKLEKGKYTDTPVRTRFGYHIIMLEDVRPVKFPALNEVRQRISQQITQGRIEELVKSLRAKAKVE
ncbi:MAG TPA: peptidylprolyl isomerase [Burkholderiales bacterium]|jgi:peptidyl-prolyl cis-trans isomerase C|nr:peptidylprolyl isomerase [Burkholderiales bacterium]